MASLHGSQLEKGNKRAYPTTRNLIEFWRKFWTGFGVSSKRCILDGCEKVDAVDARPRVVGLGLRAEGLRTTFPFGVEQSYNQDSKLPRHCCVG